MFFREVCSFIKGRINKKSYVSAYAPTGGGGEFGGVEPGFMLAREPLTFTFSIDNKFSSITLPRR